MKINISKAYAMFGIIKKNLYGKYGKITSKLL